jgi:hypothetical protein
MLALFIGNYCISSEPDFFLAIELEHSSKVDQLYHRYGHDYHHFYSVRYATT